MTDIRLFSNITATLLGNKGELSFPKPGNLVAHFDATDSNNITESGGRVSQWNDIKGGNHAIQPTGGNQPLYVANEISNLNAIQFNRTRSDFFKFSSDAWFDALKSATIFIVSKTPTPVISASFSLFGKSFSYPNLISIISTSTHEFHNLVGNSSEMDFRIASINNPSYNITNISALRFSDITETGGTGIIDVYLDSLKSSSTSFPSSSEPSVNDRLAIGAGINNVDATATEYEGSIAEIIVWNIALNDADIVSAENILIEKYGAYNTYIIAGENSAATGGVIYRSADGGLSFNQVTTTVDPLKGAAFGNNRYAVCGNNGHISFSQDSEIWTGATSGSSSILHGITFNDELQFVAVSSTGETSISQDSENWVNTDISTESFRKLVDGPIATDIIASAGGKVFNGGATGTLEDLNYGVYGNGTYVIVGNAGIVVTGTNPSTLTSNTRSSEDLNAIDYGDGVFVAVGNNGEIITAITPTGAWTTRTSGTSSNLNGVSFNGIKFIAVGDNGAITKSNDGITWVYSPIVTTNNFKSITFGIQTLRPQKLPIIDATLKLHIAATYGGLPKSSLVNVDGSNNVNTLFAITGDNATQTGADRPLYVDSGINGLPSLNFSGDKFLNGSGILNLQFPSTLFIVIDPLDASNRIIMNNDSFRIGVNSRPFIFIPGLSKFYGAPGGTIPVSGKMILTWVLHSNFDVSFYLNGTFISTETGTLQMAAAAANYQIGVSQTGTAFFNALIGECAFYNKDVSISASEFFQIHQYLYNKWINPL